MRRKYIFYLGMSRLLERAAQGERAAWAGCSGWAGCSAIPNDFLHQSELVAPKHYTSTICFPSTTIPVVEHGKHHEIQFMWVRNSIHQSKNTCWPHKFAWSYQWSYDYPQKRLCYLWIFCCLIVVFAVVCCVTVMVVSRVLLIWNSMVELRWQKR
jgi:hypothetical protein